MGIPGQVQDTSHLYEENVNVTSAPGHISAYLTGPRDKKGPGIVVIHEAFGLNDHIRDVARRFANLGYHVIAPDLYTRGGAPQAGNMDDVFAKMFGLSDSQSLQDLEACAGFLRQRTTADARVGAIGFCSGGRHTLLFACGSKVLQAAAPCWGGFIYKATPKEETIPTRPVPIAQMARNLSCPIYLAGGGKDLNPAPEELERLAADLKPAGQPVSLKIYPDVGHAFLADYRPSYDETQANVLWGDLVKFFGQHLQGKS